MNCPCSKNPASEAVVSCSVYKGGSEKKSRSINI
jgi:hypothetical protein